MTNQEIFDKVYKHLITLNARSTSSRFHGCAVLDALGFMSVADDTLQLLGRLQLVHDTHNPLAWPLELADVAATFNLTVPTL